MRREWRKRGRWRVKRGDATVIRERRRREARSREREAGRRGERETGRKGERTKCTENER
jgi:hypothetical protein